MAKFKRADLSKIKTISIKDRYSKVSPKDFAKPFDGAHDTFAHFVESLPNILMAAELRTLVEDVVRSRAEGKPVILMMGAHVVKVGLTPVLIDLLQRKVITAVAMNSAAAIHDVETAMWGQTSEDVAANMMDGRFGMARETGELINGVLVDAYRNSDMGYGEALGKKLVELNAPNAAVSLLASCYRHSIPITVHAAIGTDIIHQHPAAQGAVLGEASYRDFRTFAAVVAQLEGGVLLNIGSAVILPEVFLKALTIARNLGHTVDHFTTATFDMNRHYRPTENVVRRPTRKGGRGYYIVGHHELLVPLWAAAVIEQLTGPGDPDRTTL